MMQQLAFLATGSEILSGDTLNTNVAAMATVLKDRGYTLGQQMVVDDTFPMMQSALLHLMQTHAAVIICGGLGPTEDDITRQVIAEAIAQPLVLYPDVWEKIETRFKYYGLVCSENNRQQAYFPPNTDILHNEHGTACGGSLAVNGCRLFWLPGPPNECLPMFHDAVMRLLAQHLSPQPRYRWAWLLLRASESDIANRLAHLQDEPVEIAYCVDMPYLRITLTTESEQLGSDIASNMHELLSKECIDAVTAKEMRALQTATHQCQLALAGRVAPLYLIDHACGGRLLAALLTPQTMGKLQQAVAIPEAGQDYFVCERLCDYWQDRSSTHASVDIQYRINGRAGQVAIDIPMRGQRTLQYAVGIVAGVLLRLL